MGIELKTGSLALYRTVRNGLLPVKVIGVERTEGSPHAFRIHLRVTANREGAAWRFGETFDTSASWVIPRDALKYCRGSYHTKFYTLPYKIVCDGEG